MKDIEKIKSEDLGCQVQDANPGNFAIEQEVAQLVGATVPAPTQPSADDARELGAQLLVFLRRALLPIRSALRTALADLYAHLDSRCTDYTPAAYASYIPRPYDPMGSSPRILPNLLTAITAFAPRKISNGSAPADGIKDGVSLARLLCSSDASAVTEIADDSPAYVYARQFPWSTFANLKKATLNLSETTTTIISGHSEIEELVMPYAKKITTSSQSYSFINSCAKLKKIDGQAFQRFSGGNGTMMIRNCPLLEEIDLRNSEYIYSYVNVALIYGCPNLKKLRLGQLGMAAYDGTTDNIFGKASYQTSDTSKLEDIEFSLLDKNTNLCQWNPTDKGTTFLQNFL